MFKEINSFTKTRLLISAIFFVVVLFLFKSSSLYIPSLLSVSLGQWQTGSFSVYLDSGKGFNEDESYHSHLTLSTASKRTLYFLLSDKNLQRIRIDPGRNKGKVSINDICLHGVLGSRCWSAQDLESDFAPRHDISGFEVNGNSLDLISTGHDPYFIAKRPLVFNNRISAKVPKWVVVIVAIAFSVLSFYITPVFLHPGKYINRVIVWYHQYSFRITITQLSAISILFSLLASGLWLQLDILSVWLSLGLLFFLTFLAYYRTSSDRAFVFTPVQWRMSVHHDLRSLVSGIFFGLIVIAPIFIFLILTWAQEFPYIGDNQYHKSAFISSLFFWNQYGVLALIFMITGILAVLAGRLKIWIPLAFLFLFASSYFGSSPAAFLRYPGIGRIFGNMMLWVTTDHSQWDSFFNILRTSNALAVVVWIFVLRPLIIRRWPGIGILPFAFLFFYQQEIVDYFTSAYLEPWALIFVLLGVELIMVAKTVRSQIVAYLLVGIAALIKEQMIFILPFVWLASRPWTVGERLDKSICGFAAIIPFLIYYLIRKDAEVSRGFSIAPLENIFSLDRLSMYGDRIQFHFGITGVFLILSLFGLYAYMLIKPPVTRAVILALIGAFLFQIVFFYYDGGSLQYAGYPRFLLAAYLMLCVSALFLSNLFKGESGRLQMLAVAAGILIFQVIMLVPYTLAALKPDAARNFTQHYDHPVFLPIADLIGQAENNGVLDPGQRIYVADPTSWDISSINSDYSKLGKKYKFSTGKDFRCSCDAENIVTIAPFIYFGNLNRNISDNLNGTYVYARPPLSFYRRWQEVNKKRPQCVKQVMATCKYSFKTMVDGEIVGIMGVGEK